MRALKRHGSRDVIGAARAAGPALAPPSSVFALRTAAMAAGARVVRACALLIDTWHAALSDLVHASDDDTRAYWTLRLVPLLPPPDAAFAQLGVAAELATALLGHDADARGSVTAGFLGPMLALRAAADAGTLAGAMRDATTAGCLSPILSSAARLKALWGARAVRALDALSACERIGLLEGIESDAPGPGTCCARPALHRMYNRSDRARGAGNRGQPVREPGDAGDRGAVLPARALPGAAGQAHE